MKQHFFTTSSGEDLPIGPISLLDVQLAQQAVVQEFRLRGEPIDPPTYSVETIGGDIEYHPHTAVTIKDASPEEVTAFTLHLEAINRMNAAIERRTKLVYYEGIKVNLPADDAWATRREQLFGEIIPTDPEERRIYYVDKIKLKTPADKNGIIWAITEASMEGSPAEAIDAARELFRGQIEQANRRAFNLPQNSTRQDNVVSQPADEPSSGGESVGNPA